MIDIITNMIQIKESPEYFPSVLLNINILVIEG